MHSFYINLDRRADRRKEFEEECVRMGIRSERFPAVPHSMPSLGCTMSHLEVLKLARARGYERVCIFEDDFEFLIPKEEYEELLTKLPTEFDVVMLGWYIHTSAPYNETFGKVLAGTTTSAYIVHSRFYDTLIQRWEEAVMMFQRNIHTQDVNARYTLDQYWRPLQPGAVWLHTLKRTGRQRTSFSDLVGAVVSYEY
jgi:glycosyl transferase family 25